MKPEEYRPIYDTTVTEKYLDADVAGGWSTRPPAPINPQYCLTLESAEELEPLFTGTAVGKPHIFTAPPIEQAEDSPYVDAFNHNVPWFRFDNGAERNAGQLAMYWGRYDLETGDVNPMPGVPYTESLNLAVKDVETPVGV